MKIRFLPTIVATLCLCATSPLIKGQTLLYAPEPDKYSFDAGESLQTTEDTIIQDFISIRDGGLLINGAGHTLYNNNKISIETGGELANFGTTENNVGREIFNSGRLAILTGSLNNHGKIKNSGSVDNGLDGTVNNNGILNNDVGAHVGNGLLFNNTGALNNYGRVVNVFEGTLNNSGILNNEIGGALTNVGILNNSGTLKNDGGIFNGGTINSNNAIINNGLIVNTGTINGDVDVKAGGVLRGFGTINGSVLLEGYYQPGIYVGETTTGDQTWVNGGRYRWQIKDSDGTAGADAGWDLVNITAAIGDNGVLDLSQLSRGGFGIEIVTLNDLNQNSNPAKGFDDPNGVYEFVILTTEGGIVGFEAEDFVINDGAFRNSGLWHWSIAQDGNNLVLRAVGYTIIDFINYIIEYTSDDEVIFDSEWRSEKMRDAFIYKLEVVLQLVTAAEATEDPEEAATLYFAAMNIVNEDLIPKTDGLQGVGARTQDDWITTQEAQDILYPDLLFLSDYLAAQNF